MPLRRVSVDDMAPQLVPLWEDAMATRGEAGFVEAGANAPELLDWYLGSFYQGIFFGGRVERRVKELVRLRLSKLHGCHY